MEQTGIRHEAIQISRQWQLAFGIVLALAIPLFNPIGYVGGGGDDRHYLEAARCWVEAAAPCLAQTHWESRWPAIAPLAIVTGLFGESRLSVSVASYLPFIGCVLLLAWLVRFWFEERAALIAVLLFASTPVVASSAFQPSVDTTELALQLGALALAVVAWKRQAALPALLGGALAALAVQSRDTSLLFCGASASYWLLLERGRRRVLLWAIPGFIAALAMEPLAYAIATGDPLYRYRLSLGHVAIPSAELAAGVDISQSPFFNSAYIAGWRRDAGIELWWPVDPWLNLLASARSGFLLSGMVGLLLTARRYLPAAWKTRTNALTLLPFGVAVVMVYGLAVDPKPRMFMLLLAAAAGVSGALTVAAWRVRRGAVAATMTALMISGGIFVLLHTVNTHSFEVRAARWINDAPGKVAIDVRTRSTLALVPAARGIPQSGDGKSLIIIASNEGCGAFGLPVVDSVGEAGTGALCLLDISL